MGNLFSCDGIIYRILSKFSELLFLGLLWFVFSVPFFTIGTSTTALYYSINKVVLKKRGKIWESFWYSFRTNFKQSTIAWLIILALYLLTFINFYILRMVIPNTNSYFDYIILAIILLMITTWSNYVAFYIARFGNTLLSIFKNAFLISFGNIIKSFFSTFLLLGILIVCYLYLPLIFVLLPAYTCIASKIFENVFSKYISLEEDTSSTSE